MSEDKFLNRRNFIKGGATSLAALAAGAALVSNTAQANTMEPKEAKELANPNGRFAGKVVAITGGNSGIGKATAQAFALEGAKVFITARRDALGKQVAAELRQKGGDVTWMVTDVRHPDQVERFINTVVSKAGRLDVLFNNAGIFMTPKVIEEISVQNFQDMMATNVEGVFYGMKYAMPVMKKQGEGVIVNMASVAGHRGFANTGHYSASKHAVIGLTKAAANGSGKDNIRINSISPLAVDTPMLEESFAYQGVTYEQMAPHFVTPRIMDANEIAEGVMFLASAEGTAINGMDLDCTGGQLA